MKLLAGNHSGRLTEKLGLYLDHPLVTYSSQAFSDGEIGLELLESMRGEDIFVIQSTATPVNDNLMGLLMTIDALRRSAARRVYGVIPYLGYSRQDRKTQKQPAIPAKLVANLLTTAGVDHVIALDLHTPQIQGFFDIPVEDIASTELFAQDIRIRFPSERLAIELVIVAADMGSLQRARALAIRLGCSVGAVDKLRTGPNVSQVMDIMGDIKGKTCILVDDLIDSGDTLCNAATALINQGAKAAYAYVTHALFSKGAERVIHSDLTALTVTDSIHQPDIVGHGKIRVLSVAPLIAGVIEACLAGRTADK